MLSTFFYAVVSNPADSHETDHAKNDFIIIDEDSVPDDNQTLLMCSDIRPRIGLDDSSEQI